MLIILMILACSARHSSKSGGKMLALPAWLQIPLGIDRILYIVIESGWLQFPLLYSHVNVLDFRVDQYVM